MEGFYVTGRLVNSARLVGHVRDRRLRDRAALLVEALWTGARMTVRQFIAMIGEAETGALKTEDERLRAIGDGGLAGGYYQQHWKWRVDNWPTWAWAVLRMLDRIGLEAYCAKHPSKTARELADAYNLGHEAPDPEYDKRCRSGLANLGLPLQGLEELVKD